MCKVLKVSKSGYYYWLGSNPSKRWLENEALLINIQDIFQSSHRTYGSPRISAELRQMGIFVSRPRIARIMRAAGIYAIQPKKYKVTTDSKHNYPIAPNLLERNFNVKHPNQVWVSDITYVRTKQGWLYLTIVIDLFDRKVIGWAMSNNLSAQSTVLPPIL
jgi:putative transposase